MGLCQVSPQLSRSGVRFAAGVTEPFSAMELDFVLVPIMATLEKAVGLRAVAEGTHVGPKITEHVFPSSCMLAVVAD